TVRDRITVLLDEMESTLFNRDDEREVRLVDVGVNSLRSVRPLNHVLAELHPRVLVNNSRGELSNRDITGVGIRLWSHTGRSTRVGYRRRCGASDRGFGCPGHKRGATAQGRAGACQSPTSLAPPR